ncbi:MAG: hypothetical protein IV090_17410 [Candidatus Sericytochromatia bacterium]|nr:hypothetical protein [Candidatus Sericytochromatia bacterium]
MKLGKPVFLFGLSMAFLISACQIPVVKSPSPADLNSTVLRPATPAASPTAQPVVRPSEIPSVTPVALKRYALIKSEVLHKYSGKDYHTPLPENTPILSVNNGVHTYSLNWQAGQASHEQSGNWAGKANTQKTQMTWNEPPAEILEGQILPITLSMTVLANDTNTDAGAEMTLWWDVDGIGGDWLVARSAGNPVLMNTLTPVGSVVKGTVAKALNYNGDHFQLGVDLIGGEVRVRYLYHYKLKS